MSIITKIKNFFKALFNNKKMLEEPHENKVLVKENVSNNSASNTAFEKLREDARLLELENRLIKGEITEEQIAKEDYDSIKNLLIARKEELERQLNNYAQKVYTILSKDEKFLTKFDQYQEGIISEDDIDETTIVKCRLYKRALEIL